LVQTAIGPNCFSIYVADLTTLGVTNASMQMIPPYFFQKKCDVKIEDELKKYMKWSNINKLQLNLVKSKEIVFRHSNVQLDYCASTA